MQRITSLFLFLLLTASPVCFHAQESQKGCTDPRAKNYNATASANDGSCRYKTTIYNPPFRYLLPDEIQETSGLVYFNGFLWTINDGGNPPILYKLEPETGKIISRITITNADNIDWEALAQDDSTVYIGDFGNNRGNRNNLRILAVSKKDLGLPGDSKTEAQFIRFSYPDYPGKVEKMKDNNFDCESMICIEDSLYLFSKNRGDGKTKLYRLPKLEGNYVADLMDSFDVRGLITGADYNHQTKEITLLGYTDKTWLPFLWLLYDYDGNHLFSGNKRRIDMLNIPATQTEGIAYVNKRHCIITSEGRKLFSQTAYDLNTGKWLDDTRSVDKYDESFLLPEVTATPNPMYGDYLTVDLDHLPQGTCNITMISEKGELSASKTIDIKQNGQSLQLKFKTKKLAPGIYHLQVITGDHLIELKCIKPDDEKNK